MTGLAKSKGTWEVLKSAEDNVPPDDLQKAFRKNKSALKNFEAFPRSPKQIILEWIGAAKRNETR